MTTPKNAALLTAALLLTAGHALAGDVSVLAKTDAPLLEKNPLSFWGGKAVFDFEERFRWEIRDNNYDFNGRVNDLTDDNWFLQRARLGLKLSPTPWLRIYGQLQDSREINSDRPDIPGQLGAEGDDSVDLRQAWIELGNPKEFPLTLKLGRQILSYGDERLVGAFDWNNIGRTFDAVKLRWEQKEGWIELFTSSVVVPERGSYNQSDLFNGNETDRGQLFSGLYAECNALWFQSTDLYVFHLHENDSAKYQPNALGDTNFFTIGTRWKSKPGAFAKSDEVMSKDKDGKGVAEPGPKPPVGLDYTGEYAFQTGSVRGQDLTAFAAHGDLGYTLNLAWLPRLAVGYSFATGDDDPTDRDIQTFQNLFPTNHKFYGQMDLFAWQNLHDLEFDVKISPLRNVTLRADYHAFWLESTDDAWYRANARTVRPLTPAARAAGNYVGSEIDLLATWNVTTYLQLEGGYSHFFAGDYVKDTGPGDDADFGYLQAKLSF
jgi:hypothetical protein